MKTAVIGSQFIRRASLFIIVLMSACAAAPASDVTPTDADRPLVRMTLVDRATLAPTASPRHFPTLTPQRVCADAPPAFLIIQERGRVIQDETLNLRAGPGTGYRSLDRIEALESFLVLDGVQCNEGYAWYKVDYQGQIGWIAEGNAAQYFAQPHLPG